jgi:putative transposase
MRRTFKYRVYGNKGTIANAEGWIELCRFVYNCALSERISYYKSTGKTLSYISQQNELPEIRKIYPEYGEIDAQVLRSPLHRLDQAYKGFFRRIKRGEKAGFPRFKGKERYDSFTLYENGWKLDGKYLIIRNVGTFKMKLSRPIEGDIKTITIRKTRTNEWYACFSCDNVPLKQLPELNLEIGIDIGITHFCVDSEGVITDNPRYLNQSQEELRRKQRKLSRRKKGSTRRAKARIQVAKCHEKIKNQRKDFCCKLAKEYVKKYGTIYVEDLKIKNMVKNHHLSRSISDASWGQFFECLEAKAEEAGRSVIKVNPNGTSQNCSRCGNKVEKSLAVKIHECPFCGLVMDRDENAARNILRVGSTHQALTKEVAPCVA